MLEFDPNEKKQPKTPVWATYIPSRTPEWKLHTNRGHAINAINNRASTGYGQGSPGIIYEYVDGEWVEWDRYERPDRCAHCGGAFRSSKGENSWWSTSYRLSYHDKKLTTYKQPVVCGVCYDSFFGYGVPNWKENQALCGKVDFGADISG